MNFLFNPLQVDLRLHGGIRSEDAGEVWVVPWDSYSEEIQAFSIQNPIHGTICLTALRAVWVSSVKLNFTQVSKN